LFLAGLLALMLPTLDIARYFELDLEITATGVKNPASHAAEVWIAEFDTRTEKQPSEQFTYGPAWEARNGQLVSHRQQPAQLKWHGWLPRQSTLRFGKHAWSGQVAVRINGQEHTYDLYSESGAGLTINLSDYLTGPGSVGVELRWFVLCILMATFLFVCLLDAIERRGRETPSEGTERRNTWPWWAYGLPTLVASGLFIVGFWPAQMSPDSIDQWHQLTTGNYSNHHPAAHTFFLYIISFFGRYPSSAVLFQSIMLSLVIALFIEESKFWGVGDTPRKIAAFLLPLFLVNEFLVTVLWKDIIYSIGMAYCLVATLSFIRQGSSQTRRPGWIIGLVLASLAMTLFRHNGVLVGPVLPAVLAVMSWSDKIARQRLIFISMALVAIYVGVNRLLLPSMGIPNVSGAVSVWQETHILGGMNAAGVNLTEDEKAFIGAIYPLDQWKKQYSCQNYNTVIWNPGYNSDFVNQHIMDVHKTTARLIVENPGVFLRHQLCSTFMLWNITKPPRQYINEVPLGIRQIPMSIEMDMKTLPISNDLNLALRNLHQWTNIWVDFMWRPAIFLFIVVFTTTTLSYAKRDGRLLLLAIPCLAHTVPLFWLMIAPEYRYQFGVVLSGELLPLLLFASPANLAKPPNTITEN